MARIGVLGDIHGNREALAAALAALERRGVQRLACVGDIVGYNAEPDECAAIVRERRMLAIAGNHDLIAVRRLGFGRCANNAAYALRRTRRAIAAETAAYLETLPLYREIERGVMLVHGGVRDVQQYMTTHEIIAENAAWLREDFPGARVCFFGHSHAQKVYEVDGDVRESPRTGCCSIRARRTSSTRLGGRVAQEPPQARRVRDPRRRSDRIPARPYDAAASECKAAAFGYRIPPWVDRAYSLRKRLSRLPQRALASRWAATRWPSLFQRVP
jgi:predicted phosphodiesterase